MNKIANKNKVKMTSEELILSEVAKKRELKLKEKMQNQKFYQKVKEVKTTNKLTQ